MLTENNYHKAHETGILLPHVLCHGAIFA